MRHRRGRRRNGDGSREGERPGMNRRRRHRRATMKGKRRRGKAAPWEASRSRAGILWDADASDSLRGSRPKRNHRNERGRRTERKDLRQGKADEGNPEHPRAAAHSLPHVPSAPVPQKIKVLGRGMGARGKGDSPFSKGCPSFPANFTTSLSSSACRWGNAQNRGAVRENAGARWKPTSGEISEAEISAGRAKKS